LIDNEIYEVSSGDGIYVSWSSALENFEVVGNKVHHNDYRGIYLSGSAIGSGRPVVRANEVFANGFRGTSTKQDRMTVRWWSDLPEPLPALISLNRVYQNKGLGLTLEGEAGADLVANSVWENGGAGLSVKTESMVEAHFNNIHDNELRDIVIGRASNGRSSGVAADHNWWGPETTREMDAGPYPKDIDRIYDIHDYSALEAVTYGSWLDKEVILDPPVQSWVRFPADGSALRGPNVQIQGSASASDGIERVEVSTDGGATWHLAEGSLNWRYEWMAPGDGTYRVLSRAVSSSGSVGVSEPGNTIVLDSSLPTQSGALQSDEVWSGDVELVGDIVVPEGRRLTLLSGARVRAVPLNDQGWSGEDISRVEIIVAGELVVEGTAESPVVLTSSSDSPTMQDWGGIRAHNAESVVLRHAVIEHGSTGVLYRSSGESSGQLVLENCTVRNIEEQGIYVEVSGESELTVLLEDNLVHDIGRLGIYLSVPGAIFQSDGPTVSARILSNRVHHTGGNFAQLAGGTVAPASVGIGPPPLPEPPTHYGIYATLTNAIELRESSSLG